MQYKAVLDIARSNHDVIALDEVLTVVTLRTLHRWLSQRKLFMVAPRVYSPVMCPTWRSRVHAGTLVHPSIVVARRTAAHLWGFAPMHSVTLDFLAPVDAKRAIPGAVVHESNTLPEAHIAWKDRTRVTIPTRTLIDASASWNESTLKGALTKGLDKRLFTVAGVQRTLESMRARGRRRISLIDSVLKDRDLEDPKLRSELERIARRSIDAAGLPAPVGAHPIPLEHFTLHPDLCYPDLRLAIELDGFDTHSSLVAFHDDRRRDSHLTIEGWRVERFSFKTIDMLVPVIKALLPKAA